MSMNLNLTTLLDPKIESKMIACEDKPLKKGGLQGWPALKHTRPQDIQIAQL